MGAVRPVLQSTRVQALEWSTAEHAGRQEDVPAGIWAELVALGLVSRTRAVPDGDATGSDREGPARSWFELTLAGAEALFAAGGTSFDSNLCWSCGQWYSSRSPCPTCPACGFYAPDE